MHKGSLCTFWTQFIHSSQEVTHKINNFIISEHEKLFTFQNQRVPLNIKLHPYFYVLVLKCIPVATLSCCPHCSRVWSS